MRGYIGLASATELGRQHRSAQAIVAGIVNVDTGDREDLGYALNFAAR